MRRLVTVLATALLSTAVVAGLDPVSFTGAFSQGGVVRGQAPAGSAVTVDGKAVRVSPEGRFVFGMGRDHDGDVEVRAQLPDGSVWSRSLAVSAREYRIQRIDGLPPKQVTPDAEALKRIRREAARAAAARRLDDPRTDFAQDFIWPAQGPISGVYGSQRILNGQPRRPHFGVDVAAPTGTPVVAPAGGVITMVHPDMYFSGGTIILDHGHGLSSSFLHLSEVLVEEGQRVEQGDLIGKIGATGRVTGAHLDWRMNWFTERVDPQLLVPPQPVPGE